MRQRRGFQQVCRPPTGRSQCRTRAGTPSTVNATLRFAPPKRGVLPLEAKGAAAGGRPTVFLGLAGAKAHWRGWQDQARGFDVRCELHAGFSGPGLRRYVVFGPAGALRPPVPRVDVRWLPRADAAWARPFGNFVNAFHVAPFVRWLQPCNKQRSIGSQKRNGVPAPLQTVSSAVQTHV